MFSARITRCAIPLLILSINASPGPPARASESQRPVRVRIHWTGPQGRLDATGNALGMVGDTLLMDRLITYRQGAWESEPVALMPRVNLPGLESIEVSHGTRGNSLLGAGVGFLLGVVLGALAFNSYTSSPLTSNPSNSGAQGLTILGGGMLFAAIGAGVGAAVRSERWEPVHADSLRALVAH